MSINWQLDVNPMPTILVLPPDAVSLDEADAAIELWEHYRKRKLDSTQRLVVYVMMAENAKNEWAAKTTGREMPRQNGKGDEVEVVELWGLVKRAEAILHTVHEAALLATQTQQRMLGVLEGHADLRKRVLRVHRGIGQQMIELRNGGVIWYRTRSSGGGRGLDDISRLVVDESQHATEEQLSASTGTLMANPNPQMNVLGTSALEGRSAWWWMQRIRALSKDPGAFGYVGHTAERVEIGADGVVVQHPVDVDDRSLWVASNPSVAAGRGQGMDALEEQLRRLGPASFAQEHLGVWAPPPLDQSRSSKLPSAEWVASAREGAKPPAGRIALAYDVDLEGRFASITIAAGNPASPYVETIKHEPGVAWLAAELVRLTQAHNPLAVGFNGAGPALEQFGSVSLAFRDAGLDVDLLKPCGQSEYRGACGAFLSAVKEGRLVRPMNQQPLDLAGGDATERPLAEGWVWHRRQATVPISPLVSATVAVWLLPTEVDVPKPLFAY